MGGKNSKEGSEFRKNMLKKRMDVVIEYEGKDLSEEGKVELMKKELAKPGLKASDVAQMSDQTWDSKIFKDALEAHIVKLQAEDKFLGTETAGKSKYKGAGSIYKSSVRQAV